MTNYSWLHRQHQYTLHSTHTIYSIQEGSEKQEVQMHMRTEVQPLVTLTDLIWGAKE